MLPAHALQNTLQQRNKLMKLTATIGCWVVPEPAFHHPTGFFTYAAFTIAARQRPHSAKPRAKAEYGISLLDAV